MDQMKHLFHMNMLKLLRNSSHEGAGNGSSGVYMCMLNFDGFINQLV